MTLTFATDSPLAGDIVATDFETWTPELLHEFDVHSHDGNVGSKLLSQNDRVRVWEIRLGPGERWHAHRHVLDYFWTAVNAGRSRQHTSDGTTREVAYSAGETRHFTFKAGQFLLHDIQNSGDTDLVFSTIEHLDSANNALPVDGTGWRGETIGVIGAGNVGSQVARRAIQAGYTVVIANSTGAASLQGLVAELGPAARAATVAEAATAGDLVVVAIPISSYAALPAAPFAGRIVLDTGNYYPEIFGAVAELEAGGITTSEFLSAKLPAARVVKALNNIGSADLGTDGQLPETPGRRALAVAGDDAHAKALATDLLDAFGFDVVDAGVLAEGWRYERDLAAYGIRLDAQDMRAALAAAVR